MSAQHLLLHGRCVCQAVAYTLTFAADPASPKSCDAAARTSLCHCSSCKRAFGGAFGLTAKVPLDCFSYDATSASPTIYKAQNGVTREFCTTCGSYVCEYGERAKDEFRFVCVGTLDEPEALPAKGEFFCKDRMSWMPEIANVFHKQEIKE